MRIVAVMKCINEDTLEVSLQFVFSSEDAIEFRCPELLSYWRIRLHPNPLSIFSVVPVGGLENGVIPKHFSKHFLEQPNHRAESVGHPVVGLFEGDDEDMNIFDFIPQSGHQVLDGLLLLHQFVPKARSINDRESGTRCSVPQPVALVRTRPLGDAVQPGAHFKTAISKKSPVVVLVSSNQDIGQTGFAHSSSPEDDDPGTWKSVFVVVFWHLDCP